MTTSDRWRAWVGAELDGVRAAGRWRTTRSLDAHGPSGRLGHRPVVSFASNDYLGLSTHPAVVAAAHEAIDRWGTGSTASRLVVGTRPCHEELEAEIALATGTERAVVLASGYAANLGVLQVAAGPGVTVLSDELNHASIIDGCRLSRSRVQVYRHADVDHVDALLAATRDRALVVTDSVFSMDGDIAPVDDLAACCARHGALLVLDEAHAVLGPEPPSPGSLHGLDLLRVGTLSKALGALGGWVAGPAPWIDLLVNRARPFIFSTALTPGDAAAALAALQVVRSPEGAALVARLRDLVDRVRPHHPSPIVPIVLGSEERALAASDELLDAGLYVPAIRPPTVPPGTSRLRVALSAAHTEAMADRLVAALDGLGPSTGSAGPAGTVDRADPARRAV